jgi:phospholipid/cholesterol/gamma-HCH transport system substrate-binding protein
MRSAAEIAASSALRMGVIGVSLCVCAVLVGLDLARLPYLDIDPRHDAVFAEAGGLIVGDRVVVAGVNVGSVTSIDLVDGNADVTFAVDSNVRLGDATTAEIATDSLLGRRAVVLSSYGNDRLRAGETIPLERTESPYSLTDALEGLTAATQGIDTDRVGRSLNAVSDVVKQVDPQLSGVLDGLTRLSTTIDSRDDDLTRLLQRAKDVTAILAKRSDRIDSLFVQGAALLGELDGRRTQIAALIEQVGGLSQQLTGLVADNEATLAPALDRLNRVTDLLQQKKSNIDASLTGLSIYAGELADVVASGPFYYAYVANLVPGQYLQPLLNAGFGLPQPPLPIPEIVPNGGTP